MSADISAIIASMDVACDMACAAIDAVKKHSISADVADGLKVIKDVGAAIKDVKLAVPEFKGLDADAYQAMAEHAAEIVQKIVAAVLA